MPTVDPSAPQSQSTTADLPPKRSLEIRDYIVAVPLVASGLALLWEIGSFIPIGASAFSFFTVTEHLGFAIPALPYAISLALGMAIAEASAPIASKMILPKRPELLSSDAPTIPELKAQVVEIKFLLRKLHRRILAIRAVLVLLGLGSLWLASIVRSAVLVLAGVVLIVTALATGRSPQDNSRPLKLMFAAITLALLALTTGIDTTRAQMRSETSSLATIKFSDGIGKRVILRSGDRGLLSFDPREQRFLLEKWDDISAVDWPRPPITPPLSYPRFK